MEGPSARPHNAALSLPSWRTDATRILYWVTLGAAAGGLGGLVFGGIGGRLAMFVLRHTSHDSVRGVETDDGFIIGRFDLLDTAELLLVTTIMGVVVGLIVVAGKPFLPAAAPAMWGVAGLLLGGGLIVRRDGIDFTLLAPAWLAVAMFVVIPGSGAAAIALLARLYERFWWRQRRLTFVAMVPALPALAVLPLGIFVLVVALLWLLALRLPGVRELPRLKPVRVLALVVFAALVVLGGLDLLRDTRALL